MMAGFAATAFFDRTYQEAFALLREARDYLAYCHERDVKALEPFDRLRFSCESTRLTARLTDIMAWLFVQKAVAAGEISIQEAAEEPHRLLRRPVCLDEGGVGEEGLPRGLRSLLERSHKLYLRIARLDELVAREAA
jgi:regulator of CtrA degradation